jgi:hypothetical protein
MPAGVRPAHQYRIADLSIVQVFRDGTSVIALDREIEETHRARQRRRGVWTLDLLAVRHGMDVEKIAGQHVQSRIGRKLESECLRVMGVRLDVSQPVRARCFRLDAGDAAHSRDAYYGIVSTGAIPESGQIDSVLLLDVFCLFGRLRIGIGRMMDRQVRENRLSRCDLLLHGLRQPAPR